MTEATFAKARELAASSAGLPVQNTATTSNVANLRLEPGRTTPVLRRLGGNTRIEVLERASTPRPGQEGAWDVWYKVRVSPDEVGWLFSGLMDFDMPEQLAPYSEEHFYPAARVLKTVDDPVLGSVNWYVVAERKPGLDPHLDFSGIRVFTWDLTHHRYETAFRLRNLRGVYPLEVDTTQPVIVFRFSESISGGAKKVREFALRGVNVRETRRVS